METRKIALIIFLTALIFLSLGMVMYVLRQGSEVKNLQANKLSASPVTGTAQPTVGTSSPNLVTKEGKPITEEEIKAKIDAKKIQITEATKGRAYTSEELFFVFHPRQAAISELKQK